MSHGVRPPLIAPAARPLLARVLVAALLVFGLLQVWRPYYYLTDDNLSVGLPFLTEIGRHLKAGQSPFYSDYLFGGHYDLLRDAMYFNWHPLYFVVSLLADTPGRFAMLDLIALVHVLLAASGFALLGAAIRDELALSISDGRLLFLTLSFTFSTFALTTGAGWVNLLGNQGALPWLALGLWQTRWRRGLALLTIFSVHQILGGQLAGTVSNDIFLTLFAGLLAAWRRRAQPLVLWIAANVLAFVVLLPLLLPVLGGFFHSTRGAGITLDMLQRFAMPVALVPISLLFGNDFAMAAYFAKIPAAETALLLYPRLPTLLACAAAWCVFPLLVQRRRWTLLEGGCAALVALLLLMIVRPLFITEVMTHLPVLRSMRWPFREILQLLFFLHLLLVIRPWGGTPALQNRIACVSLGLFALPLLFAAPLTLFPLQVDRTALFSGQAERYWSAVKQRLSPNDVIATVIDPHMWASSQGQVTYALPGTADFPDYFKVRCISGYSQTIPLRQLPTGIRPYYWFGAYTPEQMPAVLRSQPNLRVITVSSFDPLRLSLSSPQGPIDLTPFLRGE
jgi:hypothetical protein